MGTLAEGIKEIFATAKTTGSNVMLCGNDGTPDGHMTMSNLASVLGVSQYSSISDFNNATTKGVFTAWGTPANAPINDTRLWVVRVERYVQNASYGISQMAYCADDNKMFYRISNISTTWGDWKEISTDIPTFYKDYSTLASLASAIIGVTPAEFSGDLNDVPDGLGIYYQNSSSIITQMSHKPSGMSSGEMQFINLAFQGYGIQFIIASNQDKIWYRTKHGSNGFRNWILLGSAI